MEALLEEKEKEIVQKGERLKVSFLSMLEGNKSCRSVSGCGKIVYTSKLLFLLLFVQRVSKIQLHN